MEGFLTLKGGSVELVCYKEEDRLFHFKIHLEGGKAVGLDTAGVLYGYGSPEEIRDSAPTYVAATPLEILDLVKNA